MRYERSLGVADRIGRLVELIRTGKYSTPALAEMLSVSDQTIYRDVLFLKQRGYSIRSVKHPLGWAYELLSEPGTAIQEAKGASES